MRTLLTLAVFGLPSTVNIVAVRDFGDVLDRDHKALFALHQDPFILPDTPPLCLSLNRLAAAFDCGTRRRRIRLASTSGPNWPEKWLRLTPNSFV